MEGIKFTEEHMISFGEFIRSNFYGDGSPRLISYDITKYDNGTIEEIFVMWCCENNY